MPPLILHNVPDDELYTGADGVQRPYAMLFPSTDGNPSTLRSRKMPQETGSFGKSTRRSRSRTGTPAAAKREDPTIAAGDAVFSAFLANRTPSKSESPTRKPSVSSQPNSSNSLVPAEGNSNNNSSRYVHKEPVEVILRGYKYTHQYAALREFERIAGRICEDYPRDPPQAQRRYKADHRDPSALRGQMLTPEEKTKTMRYAGGNNWIKVTFESAEAADLAIDASPHVILGHFVYAELYRGVPPTADEAIPDTDGRTPRAGKPASQTLGPASSTYFTQTSERRSSTLPRSFGTPAITQVVRSGVNSLSPPESNSSSRTIDSATASIATASSATLTGAGQFAAFAPDGGQSENANFCTKIPTARRVKLISADQALLPQQSYSQQLTNKIPLVKWFSSDMIGSTVPRTESGDFDWVNASLYWKIMYWIDSIFGWFSLVGGEKED